MPALPHACNVNLPSWGWSAPKASSQTGTEVQLIAADSTDARDKETQDNHKVAASLYPTPAAKAVIEEMDAVIMQHKAPAYDYPKWSKAMEPFWTKDFIYDSTKGTGLSKGMHD